jgi:hypothetical protein
LCGCKYTHNEQGFCDGTHRKEEGVKKYNEFLLKANNKLKLEKENAVRVQTNLETRLAASQRKQNIANAVAALSAALIAVGVVNKYFNFYK